MELFVCLVMYIDMIGKGRELRYVVREWKSLDEGIGIEKIFDVEKVGRMVW